MYYFFDLLFKPGSWHHDAAATSSADGANVGAQPHHAPFVPAARVGLAQTHDVVQSKVHCFRLGSFLHPV